jgi:hypothetical protein
MPRKSSIVDSKNSEEKPKKPRLSKSKNDAAVIINDAATSNNVIIKPKRGRKSKTELMALLNNTNIIQLHVVETDNYDDNDNDINDNDKNNNDINDNDINDNDKNNNDINDNDINDNDINDNDINDNDINDNDINDNDNNNNLENVVTKCIESLNTEDTKIIKKRGRKPKGGKIIQNTILQEPLKIDKPNIILHLKCSLKDLEQPLMSSVESYSFNSNELGFELINKKYFIM